MRDEACIVLGGETADEIIEQPSTKSESASVEEVGFSNLLWGNELMPL